MTFIHIKDISSRISTLTFRIKDHKMVLINVHAPTEDKTDEEKDEFYFTLEDVMDISLGNVNIVLDHFNEKSW